MKTVLHHIFRMLATGSLLTAGTASADEWLVEGQLGFGARYSDNPTLLPDTNDPKSTEGTVGSAAIEFERESTNRRYSFRPRVTRNWYPDRDLKDAEYTNLYLDGSAGITNQRNVLNISFSASDQGILASEEDASAGFLNVDDTRKQFTVSPSVAFLVSPKDQISISTSFTDVDFERDFTSRFDYESRNISVFWNRTIDERHSLGATVLVSRYESDALGVAADPVVFENDTDGSSVSINYSYRWSETTDLNLSFGQQNSDLESNATVRSSGMTLPFFPTTSNFDSTQYNLTVQNKTEKGSWSYSASRAVTPSSTGTPSEKWQLSANIKRRLAPTTNGQMKLLWYRQEATGEALSIIRGETKFFRLDAEFSWNVASNTSLVWTYTFRQRNPESGDFEGDLDNQATENVLVFGARYNFNI